MNPPIPPQPPESNEHDSWRPADKAADAAMENPAEFRPQPATESSTGPVLAEDELPLKTHGDPAVDKLEK
jgi:hypothetical protein